MMEKTGSASDDEAPQPVKVYCEHGALTKELRRLRREGRITLVHFPYDEDGRARVISPNAVQSKAQWRDMNVTWDEVTGSWDDFAASPHLATIQEIIGGPHRRDALHIDSAHKSGCQAFVTRDSDILKHQSALATLLGIVFVDPDKDLDALYRLLDSGGRR